MQTENTTETRDVARELEAVLMVADVPQSAVELASALGVPVAEVKAALASLVAYYNGEHEGPERGLSFERSGAGGAFM